MPCASSHAALTAARPGATLALLAGSSALLSVWEAGALPHVWLHGVISRSIHIPIHVYSYISAALGGTDLCCAPMCDHSFRVLLTDN